MIVNDKMLYDLAYEATVNLMKFAHAGQFDRAGERYYLHPDAVCTIVFEAGFQELHILQTALLHDVLEDTDITFDNLVLWGFNPQVIENLDLLTHREPANISYAHYIQRIVDSGNTQATIVKLADLLHNTKPDRPGFQYNFKYYSAIEKIIFQLVLKGVSIEKLMELHKEQKKYADDIRKGTMSPHEGNVL